MDITLYYAPSTRAGRVRWLLEELGAPYQLARVEMKSKDADAAFRAVSPLGKVPVLVIGGDMGALPDSSLITNWLWATHEFALRGAGFVLDPRDWADRRLQEVVEGALDAAINFRYLRLDGFSEAGYIAKQRARVDRTLGWLNGRIAFTRPLGLAALSLGCAVDWIAFRNVVDLGQWPALAAFRDAWVSAGVGAGSEPRE